MLFVSHASLDKQLVEAFVELLEAGVGVPHTSIFCSSLKGQNIKPGVDFADSIRDHLGSATCVVALISEAYYSSPFCLCELGGTWLQAKSFLPVLVPPISSRELRGVLGGLQVSRISEGDDLDELRDELIKRLELKGQSTPRWNSKRATFLNELPDILAAVRYKGPVARIDFEKLEKQLSEYKKQCSAYEQQIERQKQLIRELESTKDSKAVAKIVKKHSTEHDQFDTLVARARKALAPLPRLVIEALYYETRNEDYRPRDDDWDDIQRHAEEGLVHIDPDEGIVRPRSDNRKVSAASDVLGELGRWLGAASERFGEWYEAEADGEQLDLNLRTFWKRHLDTR